MSTSGNIVINSEEISTAVSILKESSKILEGDMSSSISSDFTPLINAGLFVEGISNIKSQIDSLVTNHNVLSSELIKHDEQFEELEKRLADVINQGGNGGPGGNRNGGSGYNGGSGSGNSGYNGEDISNPSINVDNTPDGEKINTEPLSDKIPKITDETLNKLVEFINVNKESNISIKDLLFNAENAGALKTLLNKFYGSEIDESLTSLDDATLIQRELIKKVFSSESLPQSLKESSILVAQEYLVKICNEKNITVDKLLYDGEYKETLSTSLVNLYDGNEISKYELKADNITNFRTYADKVAESNKIMTEELLKEKTNLL